MGEGGMGYLPEANPNLFLGLVCSSALGNQWRGEEKSPALLTMASI